MGANEFDDSRIAAVYDIFDPDRSDLDVYASIVSELGATSVLDLGCGTGTLAIRLPPAASRSPASITMTGNAAQAILHDDAWRRTLDVVRDALAPAGNFVFETREPSARAWERWNREESYAVVDGIATWEEVTSVDWPLVAFDSTTVFPDGTQMVARSTLRFRDRAEVEADLRAAGFVVQDVRDAPDRPNEVTIENGRLFNAPEPEDL